MKRLTDKTIDEAVKEIEFPPLKIVAERQDDSPCSNNAVLKITWKNQSERFIAEVLPQATPKQIDLAILRIEKLKLDSFATKKNRSHYHPIIVAPYLNDETLKRLASAEISGIDLSGNGVLIIPETVFVYRSGEKNKFPSNTPIKNVFRGTSSLVARVFLARPDYPNVGEILAEITARGGTTTLSTVSKVLKVLEEELLVLKNETIRLVDPSKLLDLIMKNYREPEVRRTLSLKCENLQDALLKMADNAQREELSLVFNEPSEYTVMPNGSQDLRIYTDSIDKLLQGVEYAAASRFPDVTLLETEDPTVYFDRRRSDGLSYVSPLQTYLQLSGEGKREKDSAALMRKNLLSLW